MERKKNLKLDYKYITLGEIEEYEFHNFECDGDKKAMIATEKETTRLTYKQQKTYNTIKDYIQQYGYSPTIRELCYICGVKSVATIHASLKILKRKGYIDYSFNKNRTIRVIK